MRKLLLLPALIFAFSFASCKKEDLPKPKTQKEIQDLHKSKLKM